MVAPMAKVGLPKVRKGTKKAQIAYGRLFRVYRL